MNILDTKLFKHIMSFKFFMVIVIWGLIPLLLPKQYIPLLGFDFSDFQIMLMRIWGIIVLLDTFIYIYIYRYPHRKLSKYLMLFAVLDNGGLGIVLLALTPIFQFPWGVWINIPFQLFFGYWFWRFYQASKEVTI
ncbi:MAG: hypothetical protein ACEQSA_05000 [Weeksellaceae bacterium]